MRALNWCIGHIFSWSLDIKGLMISYRREWYCCAVTSTVWDLLRQQPDLPALYLSVNHDINTVRSDMQLFALECFLKFYDEKIWGRLTQAL